MCRPDCHLAATIMINEESSLASNSVAEVASHYGACHEMPCTKTACEKLTTSTYREESLRRRRPKLRRRRSSLSVIPADQPLKVAWDACTVVMSVLSAYVSHAPVRCGRWDATATISRACEIWFLIDVALNFFTTPKQGRGEDSTDGRCGGTLSRRMVFAAGYFLAWFVMELFPHLPWETVAWARPMVEQVRFQGRFNRKHPVERRFIKSLEVAQLLVRVRRRHVRYIRAVVRWTNRCIRLDGRALLELAIRYGPKLTDFCKSVQVVVAIRVLRQVNFGRRAKRTVELLRAMCKYQCGEDAAESGAFKEEGKVVLEKDIGLRVARTGIRMRCLPSRRTRVPEYAHNRPMRVRN